MKKPNICDPCAEMLRENRVFTFPSHLVHAEHGDPREWPVNADAICPTCLTRWRKNRGHRAEIVCRGPKSKDFRLNFLQELFVFLKTRKKMWLLPIIVVILILGGLIVLAQGSAIAPFIYTLF